MPLNTSFGVFPSRSSVRSRSEADLQRLYFATTVLRHHDGREAPADSRTENLEAVHKMGGKNSKYMKYQLNTAPALNRTSCTNSRDFPPKPLGDHVCNNELAVSFRGPQKLPDMNIDFGRKSAYAEIFNKEMSTEELKSAKLPNQSPDKGVRTQTIGATDASMVFASASQDCHRAWPDARPRELAIPKTQLKLAGGNALSDMFKSVTLPVPSMMLPRTTSSSSAYALVQARGFKHEVLANEDIPFPRVRVVDSEGLVGDFPIYEARALARARATDLVVLSAAVHPPLCRLVNLSTYIEELDLKADAQERRRRESRLKEFSFDPALKVKGMRFLATIDEHDLERKTNQVRSFLEKGHRVEVQILQGRAPAEDILDLALRICAEIRDLAKPEGFEESIKGLQTSVTAPKSLKKSRKGPIEELRFRLWPCTPEQAAAFVMPAHILGPRRRRGPRIAGLDDGPEDEDAWKYRRKPGTRFPIKEQKRLNDGRTFFGDQER